MIFTYSLLFGFVASLGSMPIQLAMFIVNVFFVKPINERQIPDYPEMSDEIIEIQHYLWNTLSVTHFLCFFFILMTQYAVNNWYLFANGALTFINLVQLTTLMYSAQYLIKVYTVYSLLQGADLFSFEY